MSTPEEFFQQTIDQELYDEVTVNNVPPSGSYTAVVKRLRWGTFGEHHFQHPGGSKVAVTLRLYNKDFDVVGDVTTDATPLEIRTKTGRLGLPTILFHRIAEAANLGKGATLRDFTTYSEGAVIDVWGKEQARTMVELMPPLTREALLDQGFLDTDQRYVDVTEDNRDWYREQGVETSFGVLAARPAKPADVARFQEARDAAEDIPF